MCGDYQNSTQKNQWTFSKQDLLKHRLDTPDYPSLRIYLGQLISSLTTALRLRQRVNASAQVFLSRLLVSLNPDDINLYLLVATCVYIASNAEEQPIHMRMVSAESRKLWPETFPPDWKLIAECEFYTLEELNTSLVVYHAYSDVENLSKQLGMSATELQAAWAVVNDSYYSDVPLMFDPHLVASTACFMVLILKPEIDARRAPHLVKHRLDRITNFYGNSDIDLVKLAHAVQELVSLYATYDSYDEKSIKSYVDSII